MKSPLRWLGGKGRLAGAILPCFRPHAAYVETCCGGAAVFWAKDKRASKAEILNDADGELVNFYVQLHKHGRRLGRQLDSMPYSRRLFYEMLRATPRGQFRRAVRFWYLNRVGFGGRRRGSSYGVNATRRPSVLPQTILAGLDATIERLRGVCFESLDVVRLLHLYDRPDTLFYVDPPFYGLSQGYACQFAEEDHRRLATALATICGTWFLSYNDCPEVRRLYRGRRFRRLDTRYSIGCNSAAGNPGRLARELLITNRSVPRKWHRIRPK